MASLVCFEPVSLSLERVRETELVGMALVLFGHWAETTISWDFGPEGAPRGSSGKKSQEWPVERVGEGCPKENPRFPKKCNFYSDFSKLFSIVKIRLLHDCPRVGQELESWLLLKQIFASHGLCFLVPCRSSALGLRLICIAIGIEFVCKKNNICFLRCISSKKSLAMTLRL